MFGLPIGAFIPVIFMLIIFIILCILLPISVYSAQKWAYKSYKELVKIREILQSGERIPELIADDDLSWPSDN